MVLVNTKFHAVPAFPAMNVYSFLLNHPLGQPAPLKDHVLHIDGLTGHSRTRYQFLERVAHVGFGLGAPKPEGIGLLPGDMVAIISENCLVSVLPSLWLSSKELSRIN